MGTNTGHTHRRSRRRKRRVEKHVYANQVSLWDTRWTPNNDELQGLLAVAVREARNPRTLASIIGMRRRHLDRILKGEVKAVSLNMVDRILIRSSVGYRIRELPWLTVDELVERGVWKQQDHWGQRAKKRANG